VFFLTGRPLTAHFAETQSPIPDVDVLAIGLRLPAERNCRGASTRRVDEQFAARPSSTRSGRCSQVESRRTARPFGGLVYRQAMEHLHGVRDELATRAPHRAGEPPLMRAGS